MPALSGFVETVRRYDTWDWKTKYNDDTPKKWNDLLYILGREKFIDRVANKIVANNFKFDSFDELLLDIENKQKERYIKSKNRDLIIDKTVFIGYNVGIVFAERFISELGNQLCELNPEIDFVAIISSCNTISYRTIKDDVDLSKIAKTMGGGGHSKSSGSSIDNETTNKIVKIVFNNKNRVKSNLFTDIFNKIKRNGRGINVRNKINEKKGRSELLQMGSRNPHRRVLGN